MFVLTHCITKSWSIHTLAIVRDAGRTHHTIVFLCFPLAWRSGSSTSVKVWFRRARYALILCALKPLNGGRPNWHNGLAYFHNARNWKTYHLPDPHEPVWTLRHTIPMGVIKELECFLAKGGQREGLPLRRVLLFSIRVGIVIIFRPVGLSTTKDGRCRLPHW